MLKEEAEQIGGLRYGKSHPPSTPPSPPPFPYSALTLE